jgi:gas vesicle protein GvpA/GvpJ/GvpM family
VTTAELAPKRTTSPGYLGNDLALIDLLDRLLYGGVVIQGEITLGVADIDLVKLDLRILVASIDKLLQP